MPPKSFAILPAAPNSSYSDRIVVNSTNEALKKRLDMLSMWGGADKMIFDCPSWEMGVEELAVAKKWCKQMFHIEWELKA